MKHRFLTACLSTLLAPALLADTLYLKDGTILQGDLKHTDTGWAISSGPHSTNVSADQVKSIELSPKNAGPRAAAERLDSLRRSIENVDDLSEILLRYHRFLDQVADPAARDAAKIDLNLWQDRAAQNMIKIGKRWILPTDRAKLLDEAQTLAEQARQLMKQGRSREAEPLLSAALDDDPQNVSALYLRALLRYQQQQFLIARQALDQLNYLLPNHAPTLNNLAVVQWRQRQYIPALVSYDSAMLALPINKTILDNVAVALAALPVGYRGSPVTQRVTRRFLEQDKLLAEQMAVIGLHRHGTEWISDAELQRLDEQARATQAALNTLSADFDKTKQRLDQVSRDIDDTESQMHRIEASSYIHDPITGIFIRTPYPAIYYELVKDDQRQRTERDTLIKKLDTLQQAARVLQQPAAPEKISDIQLVIGPEGTPLRAPTSQPATQP